MYLDSDGKIVLAFGGGMCRGGCNCASDDSGLACGKIIATHSGLVGCLAALNGVPVVLCPYFAPYGNTVYCEGNPDPVQPYAVAWRGAVDLGGDVVAIVALGSVELEFGGPSGDALRNRKFDSCAGITWVDIFGTPVPDNCEFGIAVVAVPTLPTFYAGPLTTDTEARTVTAALHAETDPPFDITPLTWDATATYTEISAEDCCDAECTYAELVTSQVTTETPNILKPCDFHVAGTDATQRLAFGYDCASCCAGFQFVYPGGNGPKVSFLTGDSSPGGYCFGGGVGAGLTTLSNIFGGYGNALGGTGGAIGQNYFGVAMADDPALPAMLQAWGCTATGTAYVGSVGFDMPVTPPTPPGGADFYGLFGSLTRERATFNAGTDDAWGGGGTGFVPELRDVWVYREYYACRSGGVIAPYRSRRSRWANPQGPCPPTDVGAWNEWGGSAPPYPGGPPAGGPSDGGFPPDDTTAPEDVNLSDCPACGCACGARYSSDFSFATETWSTPALLSAGGCMPKWDAPLWPDPCAEGSFVNLSNDFIRAFTWKFFDACACDLSGDACTIPTTIDPPDYVPACLKCPTAYPNCCDGYEVTYSIDGTPHVAVVTFASSGVFTSDDPDIALSCRLRLFRLILTVEGRDGSPFEWIGNDAGFDEDGSCPRISEDGAGWTPNFDDLGLTINSVRCLECDADLTGFCARMGFEVHATALTPTFAFVVFTNDGSAFTSSDSRFTLACVPGTGQFMLHAELGLAGDPYVWLADAVSPPGTPSLTPGDWVPQLDDIDVFVSDVGCWDCDPSCCDPLTATGTVSGVAFSVPMTKDDDCHYSGETTGANGHPQDASLVPYGRTGILTVHVGKDVAGLVVTKVGTFRITLPDGPSPARCPENYTDAIVFTPTDDPDDCALTSVSCDAGGSVCVHTWVATCEGGVPVVSLVSSQCRTPGTTSGLDTWAQDGEGVWTYVYESATDCTDDEGCSAVGPDRDPPSAPSELTCP
jgi:hypothetical protein